LVASLPCPETAIIIAGKKLISVTFAATLAWADFYTRGFRAPNAQDFDRD
jgi:hypothetical protein